LAEIWKEIGIHVRACFRFMKQEQYEQAFNALYPHREKIDLLGGSLAQRDVFHLALLASAIKAGKKESCCLSIKDRSNICKFLEQG